MGEMTATDFEGLSPVLAEKGLRLPHRLCSEKAVLFQCMYFRLFRWKQFFFINFRGREVFGKEGEIRKERRKAMWIEYNRPEEVDDLL